MANNQEIYSTYLPYSFKECKDKRRLNDANELLKEVGLQIQIVKKINKQNKEHTAIAISIQDEKIFNKAKKTSQPSKAGRKQKLFFTFEDVQQKKSAGMTNKQIWQQLGISRSLFYKKMALWKDTEKNAD